MGFLDDLKKRAESAVGGAQQTIFDYEKQLDGLLGSVTAQIAGSKRGEATAKEIANGQAGVPEPVAGVAGDRVRRDSQSGDPGTKAMSIFDKIPYAKPLLIGVGVFFIGSMLLKRR